MKIENTNINENIGLVEDILGYDFEDDTLLVQAFTNRSYDKEINAEPLEFVGENALSFYISKMMVDSFGYIEDLRENGSMVFGLVEFDTKAKMSRVKSNLVHKSLLSYRIEVLNLNNLILMSKKDLKENKNNDTTVEANLFYSIIGAVCVDSEYNEDVIEDAIANLLNIDYYLVNGFNNQEKDYVTLILNWDLEHNDEVPYYEYEEKDENIESQLIINTPSGSNIIKGIGYTASGARRDCAKNVYYFLEKNMYI